MRQSIVARERKAVEDSEDSNDNQGSGTNTSSPESEDLAAENAELEKVNEELEKENAELEQQNENLEGEVRRPTCAKANYAILKTPQVALLRLSDLLILSVAKD